MVPAGRQSRRAECSADTVNCLADMRVGMADNILQSYGSNDIGGDVERNMRLSWVAGPAGEEHEEGEGDGGAAGEPRPAVLRADARGGQAASRRSCRLQMLERASSSRSSPSR